MAASSQVQKCNLRPKLPSLNKPSSAFRPMVLNYSLAGDITVDVAMCKPAVLNGQGEVIMSSSQ